MAAWLTMSNGLGLDCINMIRTIQSSNCCFDYDNNNRKGGVADCDDYKEKLRCCFDYVLSVFLREIVCKDRIRPSPAMLGDGRCTDLFNLCWVVRERGGYDLVSKNGLWVSVVEELGLDPGVTASVKLIYCKYLADLDQWLWNLFKDESSENGQNEYCGNLSLSLSELKTERGRFLLDGHDPKKKDYGLVKFDSEKNDNHIDLDTGKDDMLLFPSDDVYKMHTSAEKSSNDDDENNIGNNDRDDIFMEASVAKKDFNSRKRKWESLSGMLDWVIEIVKHPNVPATWAVPEGSKWKEFLAQALLVREALFQPRPVDSNSEQSPSQKKLKMHPFTNGDNGVVAQQSTERLRCSKRIPLAKAPLCPCCNPCSATESKHATSRKAELVTSHKEPYSASESKLGNPWKTELVTSRKEPCSATESKLATTCKAESVTSPKEPCSATKSKLSTSRKTEPCSASPRKLATPRKSELENFLKDDEPVVTVDQSTQKTTLGPAWDRPYERYVSVGPQFQAEVPEWTGMVTKSDSKWLGTRVWPLENGECKSVTELDPIGKGRQNSCSCRLPGSVGCVRFHIAEERMKIKLELGLLFYRWRFDHMGEEVSLRWTSGEEKRFKNIVKLIPSSPNKSWWNKPFKYFPKRSRETLVSYYFNVFVVRRRSYQNRVTPKDIDSDDDETEFGSIGDCFGHEAINVPGSEFLICGVNKQCTVLE